MSTTTITIEAFGDTYDFSDGWNEQELDLLENAPILYVLCGEEEAVKNFTATRNGTPYHMPMDSVAFEAECGETIVFGCEYFTKDQIAMLEMLDIEWSLEERD